MSININSVVKHRVNSVGIEGEKKGAGPVAEVKPCLEHQSAEEDAPDEQGVSRLLGENFSGNLWLGKA